MKLTEPMTLTRDAVTKLALPAGKPEHTVWDDKIAGFGIRLREHSATYFFRYRHGKRQPRITIGAVSAIINAKARAKAEELYARAKFAEDPAGTRTEARKRANETFALALKPYLIRRQAEMRKRSFINLNRHLMKHAAPLHRLELAKAAERRRVAELLAKIATDSGPVEANAVKGSLNKFFSWAIGQGLLDGTGIDIASHGRHGQSTDQRTAYARSHRGRSCEDMGRAGRWRSQQHHQIACVNAVPAQRDWASGL